MFAIPFRYKSLPPSTILVCFLMVLLTSVGCSNNSPAPFELTIQVVDGQPQNVVVVVIAADESALWSQKDWQDVLSLHRVSEFDNQSSTTASELQRPAQAPMLGEYSVVGNQLRFQPAFPLAAGQRYLAHFDPQALKPAHAAGAVVLQHEHKVPAAPQSEKPRLLAIYPSGDDLPANHLKFYLHFSEPMRQGELYQNFRLENLTTGKVVPDPFRNVEIWSHDDRRLTLWFHPGRQKEGVNLNVDIGPILNAGHRYRLVVRGNWQSQSGKGLGEDGVKQFRAGPAIKTRIDYQAWVLTPPAENTQKPLLCRFGRSLDSSLLQSEFRVETAPGRPVPGRIEISDNEMSWRFFPQYPWQKGDYRLAVAGIVEDLAGNSILRPFSVDLALKPQKTVTQTVYREFKIGSPASDKSP